MADVPPQPAAPTLWSGLAPKLRLFAGVVALLTVLVAFYRLGEARTLTSHEAFVAVTTREMLATGDWVVPRFGRVLRLTKPPLAYWTVGVLSLPIGDVTEFTARLPSAISSLFLVLLVGVWAGRWYGQRAGICAALVQATSLWHTLHAREATVDMLQCLLMTAATFLVAHQPDGEPLGRVRLRWLGIYVLLGLQFLAKFHFGPILVLAPIFVHWVLERRWFGFRCLINPVGVLLAALLAITWPLAILRSIPDAIEIWRHETLGRALGEMRPEPVWYFLPLLLYLMLPWTILYPAMLRESWERSRGPEGRRERFLWTWVLVQTVLLSLSSNKHKNYVIPALPAIAILLGPTLERAFDKLCETQPRTWATVLGVAASLTGGGVMATILSLKWPHLQTMVVALGVFTGTVGAVWVLAMHARRHRAASLIAAIGFAVVHLVAVGWIVSALDHRRPVVDFARTLRRTYPDSDFCVYGMGEAAIVYYLGLPVHRTEEWQELKTEVRGDSPPVITFGYRVQGIAQEYGAEIVSAMGKAHPNHLAETENVVAVKLSPRQMAAQPTAPPR